jgi:Flp pilus assembly protein TadB
VFEQFRENIRLSRDTYKEARDALKSVRETVNRAEPLKRGLWVAMLGGVVFGNVASYLSIAWYYQAALVLALVLFPVEIWLRRTRRQQPR